MSSKAFWTSQLDSCLAAFSIYTRLPAWKVKELNAESYSQAINALPLVGLLTGSLMALIFLVAYYCLHCNLYISILLGLISRVVLTGAFHEDGLGDVFDGFGGGRDRESILRIMKDSHVGSYAIIGYILYYALFLGLLCSLPIYFIPYIFVLGDILGKLSVIYLVHCLPYVRQREESKLRVLYTPLKVHIAPLIGSVVVLILGQYLLSWYVLPLLALLSILVYLIVAYIRYKLGGYTGDTCGAIMLLVELATYFLVYLLLKV